MIKPAGQALRWLFSRPNMIKGKPDELMNQLGKNVEKEKV